MVAGTHESAGDGDGQLFRRHSFECRIYVGKMPAIQLIEVTIIGGMVLRAIPPVPVAAFGDEQLFPRQLALRFRNAIGVAIIVLARLRKQVPGLIVFGRANPYIEVRVDPRTGNETRQRAEVFVTRDRLAHGDGLDRRIALETIVEATQKLTSRLRVVFPGIFAIENHRDNGVFASVQHRPRGLTNGVEQMVGGVVRRHAGIHKTDEVRQCVIAEQHVHPGVTFSVAVNVVKLLGTVWVQAAMSIASECVTDASAQDTFVGGHPLDSLLVGEGEHLF